MENILRKDDMINNIIVFSLIWSFGGLMDKNGRDKLNTFIR